jgi:predicted transcriptional regulator
MALTSGFITVMGMSTRSRTEIVIQILAVANAGSGSGGDGSTKSEIMYKAFLSHDQLEEYLMVLTQSDLLCYDGEMRTFKTTGKGLTLLQAYNQIDEILKEQQI